MANSTIDKKMGEEKTATNNNPGNNPTGNDSAGPDHSKPAATSTAPSATANRIAVAQICSGRNPKKNIALITKFIKRAKARGARLVAFPEVCNIMERDKNTAWNVLFYEEEDPYLITIRDLARELGLWVLLGSYLLRARGANDDDKKFHNRSLLISDKGDIAAHYDKIHLFDIDLADGESYRESLSVVAGRNVVTCDGPFDAGEFGKLGLTICYDLRFPYLYRKLNHMGAGVIFVPAAFTATTGAAHWHSLLRARAIENACWIIAPAQTGRHPDGRRTFGHSLVVDPWGRVVAEAKNKCFKKNQLLVVDLDSKAMNHARAQIPAYRSYLDYSLA